ncbi:MAG TPA: hypothetical protein H9716_13250 [Candidatus Enterocloster faecavium]|uniref:Uncharacterized protein n=1 Tax=Candidatus Enterocloster faecavium TaxID=2838560 RepID=A0A9D2LA23_9FIRM|nr:hypothetical protein [Candidatus Enterocloster faecavium]
MRPLFWRSWEWNVLVFMAGYLKSGEYQYALKLGTAEAIWKLMEKL